VGLLQRAAAGRSGRRGAQPSTAPGMNPEPTELLARSRPLSWLHVPKAGSSLGNTLIHTPGLCHSLPEGTIINSSAFCQGCNEYHHHMLANFKQAYPMEEYCPGINRKWGSHHCVGAKRAAYNRQWRGKGVAMMRQPEQRIMSSYYANQHEWPKGREAAKSVLEFAEVTQGCATRMLVRDTTKDSNCGSFDAVTPEELEEAKRRLEGFVFVGLTEEWNLSICLWHAMFGGLCYGADFFNTRVGVMSDTDAAAPVVTRASSSSTYSTEELRGFVDAVDGRLYAQAQEIFWARAKEYGVSEASCQPCFQHASEHYAPEPGSAEQ